MDRLAIPKHGRAREALLTDMASFRSDDATYKDGRTWSLVYWVGEEFEDTLKAAHNLYFSENGLNPLAFKSLKRMESEVVQMTASMLHGPDTACGTMTSGGTESILMAIKAYRDRARVKWPWIRRPNIVLPTSAHVAFDKAGHYFGVRLKRVPVGADFRADVRRMARAIDRNTIGLVGSAPQYPQGVVDPIEELGALASKRKLPLHVDGCFGGFMLPWLEKLGHPVPTWDFRVPGVTSISADVHKYGYASKGASVVVYRSMDVLRHQFFVATGWPGGVYAGPTMPGSKPGGPIAAAWAAMMAAGEEGYLKLAQQALDTTKRFREGLNAIDGIHTLGELHCTCVTWASDELDVYALADLMTKKGWGVDRQQNPASVHCTVNANHAAVVDDYLADLEAAVAHLRAHPELAGQGDAAIYGLIADVPIRGIVDHAVRKMMESMYAPGGEVPDLAELGSRPEDGRVLGLLHKYGDSIGEALDLLRERLGR